MEASKFNIGGMIVNVAIGWFVLAFLHSAVVGWLTQSMNDWVARGVQIALFQDVRSSLINVAIVVGISIVVSIVMFAVRK